MKAIQVGQLFPSVPKISFLSNNYILDYDLLIVDLNTLINEFDDHLKSKRISNETHIKFTRLLDEKSASIKDF